MAASRKKNKRVSIQLSRTLELALSRHLRVAHTQNPKLRLTEADVIVDALCHTLGVGSSGKKIQSRSLLLHQAATLKKRAFSSAKRRLTSKARILCALAAAREVEALATLNLSRCDSKTETAIQSALIEIIYLLKSSTGYRTLPDAPPSRDILKTTTV